MLQGRDGEKGVLVCLLHTYDLLQAKTNLTAKAQKYYKKEPKIKKKKDWLELKNILIILKSD